MTPSRRSIRTKIISLLAVPLVGLIGVWATATVLTVGPVLTLLKAQTRFSDGTVPATDLVTQLQAERRMAVTHLSLPSPNELNEQFAATDEALAEFRSRTSGAAFRDAASPDAMRRLDELLETVGQVTDNRPMVLERGQRRPTVMALYSEAIEAAYLFMGALSPGADAELSLQGRAVVELGRWREIISQIDAIVVGAQAAGSFEAMEPHQLHQLIGARHALPRSFVNDLPESVRPQYDALVASPPMTAPVAAPAPDWEPSMVTRRTDSTTAETTTWVRMASSRETRSGLREAQPDRAMAAAMNVEAMSFCIFTGLEEGPWESAHPWSSDATETRPANAAGQTRPGSQARSAT